MDLEAEEVEGARLVTPVVATTSTRAQRTTACATRRRSSSCKKTPSAAARSHLRHEEVRERIRELSSQRASSAALRLVARMTVRGRPARVLDVVHDLYFLSLDSAKERGVCPDPSNDNAVERAN
jgi:hypothetical protein